jgi:hypothetical protein
MSSDQAEIVMMPALIIAILPNVRSRVSVSGYQAYMKVLALVVCRQIPSP